MFQRITVNYPHTLCASPDRLVANLLAASPNATAAEKYNQYRGGAGHMNVTSVLDNRRIEIGVRLKF